MFTKPPFLLTIAMLASLTGASLTFLVPIGYNFWVSDLHPINYGADLLRTTSGFALSHFDAGGCERPFSHADAWRKIVLHPVGDSLFRHIFATGKPGGRLYALIGLYQLRAKGFVAAIQDARRDARIVWRWDWNTKRTSEAPLRALVNEDSLATWARSLRGSTRHSGCAA